MDKAKPVSTKNSFDSLSREAAQAGCSNELVPAAVPKVRKTLPIMTKVIKVKTNFFQCCQSSEQRFGVL